MDTKQKFKVYCSNLEKNQFPSNDGSDELILEAIASTSSVDEEGDMITKECIESMKQQAIGLNIHLDHNHDTHNVIGNVIEVLETDNKTLKIKFKILPSWQSKILEYLDNGIALGLSIGGAVKDFEETESGWEIKDIKLYEISLTPLPANWDTFGTVKISEEELVTAKCFDGACKQVLTNLKSLDITKDVEDGEDPDEDDKITEQEVIDILNQYGIELKNQIIAEIVSEFNLDGKKYDGNADATVEPPKSDDNTKDSSDEDKEKNLDMEKEEIKELIVETIKEVNKELVVEAIKEMKEAETIEETPIVEEEVMDVVKAQDKEEEEEEEEDKEKACKDDDEKDKEKSLEEPVEEEPVLDKEALMKELREELILELKPQIRKDVEAEILKELTVEREPVETEQPKVEKDLEEPQEEETNKKVMNTRDLAKHLIGY